MWSASSSSTDSPPRPRKAKIQIFGCRWHWCRMAFSSKEQLDAHVMGVHVQNAKPVTQEDLAVMRRVEEGLGDSLSMSGIWSNAGGILSSRDTRTSPMSYIDRTDVPTNDEVLVGPSHLLGPVSEPPNATSQPSSPQRPHTPPFSSFVTLSSPAAPEVSIPSLPPSPEFNELVTNLLRPGNNCRSPSPGSFQVATREQSLPSEVHQKDQQTELSQSSCGSSLDMVETQLSNHANVDCNMESNMDAMDSVVKSHLPIDSSTLSISRTGGGLAIGPAHTTQTQDSAHQTPQQGGGESIPDFHRGQSMDEGPGAQALGPGDGFAGHHKLFSHHPVENAMPRDENPEGSGAANLRARSGSLFITGDDSPDAAVQSDPQIQHTQQFKSGTILVAADKALAGLQFKSGSLHVAAEQDSARTQFKSGSLLVTGEEGPADFDGLYGVTPPSLHEKRPSESLQPQEPISVEMEVPAQDPELEIGETISNNHPQDPPLVRLPSQSSESSFASYNPLGSQLLLQTQAPYQSQSFDYSQYYESQ